MELIDDISFKKHKQNLKNKKNIIFLNPAETERWILQRLVGQVLTIK